MAWRRRVGIRELRQNLSVHLREVKSGDTLEVTERGRPVALLTPLPERMTPRDRLLAEGRIRPRTGNLGDLSSPPKLELNDSLSDILSAQREEREL